MFGQLPDGRAVHDIAIGNDRISARILTYGAILSDLRVALAGTARPAVLGFSVLAPYLDQGAYLGAIAGRFANRIMGGTFELGGKTYQLTPNERGKTHLHGGAVGFDKKIWDIVEVSPKAVTLGLHSPAGEEGYPGAVDARCEYRIAEPATLTIELTARADAPTVINLTGHSYFNLDESADIRDHRLTIAAPEYLPVDDDLLPGKPTPVEGTRFDFRAARPIRAAENGRYDNNFIIAWTRSKTPRLMARIESPSGDLAMELSSTEPGLQFYDGAFLGAGDLQKYGKRYEGFAGFCLEPQCFPDSPNRKEFPSSVLNPGEIYRHRIDYRFFTP
jgi:aldose 1-epimerase